AMDRALAARPDVEKQLARLGLERGASVPPGLEDALRGFGTVAFLQHAGGATEVVGMRRGASSPRSLLRFCEHVRAAHLGEIPVDAEHWLEVGLPERALAAIDEGADQRTQMELRVRALLALDEVARASELIEAAAPDHVSRLAAAMVHVAGRRPAEAVACFEGREPHGPRESLVLGRALLDLGERARAYRILGEVAAGEGSESAEAAELLATAITGKDLHSDH
ncbi:MAG: hypothetical protein ACO3UM_10835, partial [Planctomycetota bacterium]